MHEICFSPYEASTALFQISAEVTDSGPPNGRQDSSHQDTKPAPTSGQIQ